MPLQVVATALGHADARMTEKHYAHLAQLIRSNLPSFTDASVPPNNVARLRRQRRGSAAGLQRMRRR